MIRFETGDGLINLTIDPYVVEAWVRNAGGGYDRVLENVFYGTFWADNQGTNLDVEARLYNASGTLVATSNPTGLRASFSNLALSAGVYYIGIDGVGFSNPRNNPPIGYTDYGSIGQYLVSGTVRSLGVSLDLGSGTASYTENTDPIPVAPAAVFRDSPFLNFDLLNLSVSIISNGEASDRLSIISTGNASGQIGVVGNQIRYGGVPFATFVQAGSQLTVDFASTSTQQAVEALIRNIAYASISDGPATLPRRIQMTFGLGTAATRDVRIIPVNDSPSLVRASLATIDEDSPTPAGQEVGFVLASLVADPDVGASVSGMAIVGNTTDPNTKDRGTTAATLDSLGPRLALSTIATPVYSLLRQT